MGASMPEIGSLLQILSGAANIVVAPILPFMVWMLSDLRRDVREIKNINIAELHKSIGDLRDRITAIEGRHKAEDRE